MNGVTCPKHQTGGGPCYCQQNEAGQRPGAALSRDVREARFAVCFNGEGCYATVLPGIANVAREIRLSVNINDDAFAELKKSLNDPQDWVGDDNGDPYRYEATVGEGVSVTIYRLVPDYL